jgi:Protein of unknown function DUF2625
MFPRSMRPLDDLLSADSAWPLVLEWQREAKNRIELLAVERSRAEATLVSMQVTTRSPMGAVVWESGGILVDRGWVRVLGAVSLHPCPTRAKAMIGEYACRVGARVRRERRRGAAAVTRVGATRVDFGRRVGAQARAPA